MSDAPERDRAAELVELLRDRPGGFGTVEICLSGRRFVCSWEDLRTAVRQMEDAAARDVEREARDEFDRWME